MDDRTRKYWDEVCGDPILRDEKIEVEWRWPDVDYSERSIGYLIGCDDKEVWLSRQQRIHGNVFKIPIEQIVCIRQLTNVEIYRPRTTRSKAKENE